MLLLISIAWAFAAIVGVLQWRHLALADRLLLPIGAIFVAVGWLLSRRPIGLWLLAGGPVTLVIAAALAESSPTALAVSTAGAWVAVSVSVSHIAYTGVLMTNRIVGIAFIVAAVLLLVVIWDRRPGNVVPGPLAVADGWIAVLAVAAASTALWVAWHAVLARAQADDAALDALTRRTEDELAVQERSRAWRAAAVQVHERLLSTVRYVLQADTVDSAGLRAFIDAGGPAPPTFADTGQPPTITEASLARRVADVVRLDPSIADLPLSDAARPALRAAVSECAINAVQHGRATDVVVSARVVGDRVLVDIGDDGIGIPDGARPGLGWSTVMDDAIASVGGKWSHRREPGRTVVTVDLPVGAEDVGQRRNDRSGGFAQGRTLMSYPLIAMATVGIAFDWLLSGDDMWQWVLRLVSVAATIAAGALVIRRRRMPAQYSLPVLLALSTLPWLMLANGPDADQVAALAAGANAAGYAIIALSIWSHPWHMPAALALWSAGVIALVPALDGASPVPVIVALVNCLVAVPVTLVVARIGARRFSMAQATVDAQREVIRREVLRANAAQAVDQHLASCVSQAEHIIEDLAAGHPLGPAERHRLCCLDGLIRASIQVDPLTSGGMAIAASSLVASAFDSSVPATVGPLLSSADPRPLPRELIRDLESAVAEADVIEVRAFTADGSDYLGVTLHGDRIPDWLPTLPSVPALVVTTDRDVDGTLALTVSRASRPE